jgi:hypothetical protein
VALLPLLLLPGCGSSEPQPGGPLEAAGQPFSYCLPADASGPITLGAEILQLAEGDENVSVTNVDLVDATSVELLEASVVRLTTTNSFGSSVNYPPSDEVLDEFGLRNDWARRQVVPTAELEPLETGDRYTLVLGVDITLQSSFDGIKITYQGGDTQYVVATETQLRVAGAGQAPCE